MSKVCGCTNPGQECWLAEDCKVLQNLRERSPRHQERRWAEAILDLCAVSHMPFHDDDPKKTLQGLIDWHVQVALDPKVSAEAQALIDEGIRQEAATVTSTVEALQAAKEALGYAFGAVLADNHALYLETVTQFKQKVEEALPMIDTVLSRLPAQNECSGDPSSCPDNEGYGCACSPKTPFAEQFERTVQELAPLLHSQDAQTRAQVAKDINRLAKAAKDRGHDQA